MERFPLLSEVLKFPDSRLRCVAKPVTEPGPDIQRGIEHMFGIMDAEDGCGLAATQLGILLRVVVIDMERYGGKRQALINPEIVHYSKEKITGEEGCLSVEGLRADVERSESIRIRYLDESFQIVEEELTHWRAINVQHEVDHLNGILFIDHLPRIKREQVKNYLRRQAALSTNLMMTQT